jgi:phage tail sheath protein FI
LLIDRFAILDVYDGGIDLKSDQLTTNRGYFVSEHLKYGAAYYPFLKTTLNFFVNTGETNVNVTHNAAAAATLASFKSSNTALYNFVKSELKEHFVVLPPSSAVAGVYAATDTNRGVWKAPANVSVANVIEPVVKLTSLKQETLNVDTDSGKSIDALRAFAGKGTLVWGARTLDGNDNEWRYIPVRRFFNMVEESVKKSTYWAVFEPNDANTWVKIRGMIENYLIQKWREGALAGATPKEAFFVKCGLGTTMTSQDILEGRMNVEIGMAVVRPAEFIILKFSHKLQTS